MWYEVISLYVDLTSCAVTFSFLLLYIYMYMNLHSKWSFICHSKSQGIASSNFRIKNKQTSSVCDVCLLKFLYPCKLSLCMGRGGMGDILFSCCPSYCYDLVLAELSNWHLLAISSLSCFMIMVCSFLTVWLWLWLYFLLSGHCWNWCKTQTLIIRYDLNTAKRDI